MTLGLEFLHWSFFMPSIMQSQFSESADKALLNLKDQYILLGSTLATIPREGKPKGSSDSLY
jgi:hypothetical protein